MSSRTADVCLILEGSYPYVAGGVSTWVHDLIRANADLTFALTSLVPDNAPRTRRYEPPENVIELVHMPLQALPSGRRLRFGEARLMRLLEAPLKALEEGAGLEPIARILEALKPHRGRLGRHVLLNSMSTWRMLLSMYEATRPESSFLDYFWTWRALHSGLYSALIGPLPDARVYHTISTGYAGLVAARAKLETGRPVLVTEHGIYTNERRIEVTMADWLYDAGDMTLGLEPAKDDLRDLWINTYLSYARACYSACDRIITLYGGNQELQKRDGAAVDRLDVIPNGIDYARYSALEDRHGEGPPTIALIGRVVPIKDIKTYIRAAALIRSHVPGLQALILGPTEEDPDYDTECRSLVAHLELGETVRFLGRVQLDDWLGRLHAIVLTSISEAQPLVILEAGAAGVPTVATDVGACREMIEGRPDETPALGPGGSVTPVASPADTASAIARLLTEPEWRARCSRAIRRRVARYYNKVDIDRIYSSLYHGLRDVPAGTDLPSLAADCVETARAEMIARREVA